MRKGTIDIARRFIERRPLALAAACYGAGAAIAWTTGAPPFPWLFLCAAALLLFVVARRPVAGFVVIMLAGALMTSGALLLPSAESRDGARIEGEVVLEPTVRERDTIVTLDHVSIDGREFPYRLRAYVYDPVDVRLGDFVEFVGNTWLPSRRTNPGGFDFAMWLWKDDIALCATANAEAVRLVGRPSPLSSPSLALARLKRAVGGLIDALFPRQPSLVRALVIGDRALLPEELIGDFRKAGVSHLLAVSGLHISCLAFALDWLLRRLYAPRKAAYLIVLGAVFLYAALVGFPASVVRAALMYALARGAPLSGRSADGLTGLSAAFLALLLAKPLNITDYGFILSFAAVGGLMLLTPVLTRALRVPGPSRTNRSIARKALSYILNLLCASAAAQLGTLPAVATLYGGMSPWSLMGNLIAVPLTVAALPLSMLGIVVGAIHLPAGILVSRIPDFMLDFLVRGASLMSKLPHAQLALPAWPAWLCAAFALMCFLCSPYVAIRERARKWMLLSLPALACISVSLNLYALPKGFSVVFLDANQADAAILHAEGEIYLADAGDASTPADDYLRYYGLSRVKGVFLSHPHSDHASGLGEVLDQASVETIYISSRWADADMDEGIAELLARAESLGSKIVILESGDTVPLSGEITATVHQPDEDTSIKGANDGSMVLHVRYGEGSALFLGDLTAGAEKLPLPDCDVLKVAHHGASGSTSELLLMTSTPSVAVISVGRNSFGHPGDATVARIDRQNIALYRTDRCGAITTKIETDGTVTASTYKTPEE